MFSAVMNDPTYTRAGFKPRFLSHSRAAFAATCSSIDGVAPSELIITATLGAGGGFGGFHLRRRHLLQPGFRRVNFTIETLHVPTLFVRDLLKQRPHERLDVCHRNRRRAGFAVDPEAEFHFPGRDHSRRRRRARERVRGDRDAHRADARRRLHRLQLHCGQAEAGVGRRARDLVHEERPG
jgi:hypothetical protein